MTYPLNLLMSAGTWLDVIQSHAYLGGVFLCPRKTTLHAGFEKRAFAGLRFRAILGSNSFQPFNTLQILGDVWSPSHRPDCYCLPERAVVTLDGHGWLATRPGLATEIYLSDNARPGELIEPIPFMEHPRRPICQGAIWLIPHAGLPTEAVCDPRREGIRVDAWLNGPIHELKGPVATYRDCEFVFGGGLLECEKHESIRTALVWYEVRREIGGEHVY